MRSLRAFPILKFEVLTGLDMKDLPRSVVAEFFGNIASVFLVKLSCSENDNNGGWP